MREVNAIMDNHITHLTAFAKAVAGHQPNLFEPVVISAYSAGADLADFLVAVEIAKALSEVPPPILARAYASIHAWHWIAARRQGPSEKNGRTGR